MSITCEPQTRWYNQPAMLFHGVFVVLISSVLTGKVAWHENEDDWEDITGFGSEEDKEFEFSPLFGDINGVEGLSHEYTMGISSNENIGDSFEKEEGYAHHLKGYDQRSSESIRNDKMFDGINKILNDIYGEHKENGNKVLETTIEESKGLRDEIKSLTRSSNPSVISEEMKYLSYSKELVITKQDGAVSVYVNITKDKGNRDEIDQDGHRIHIHIPHRVLVEMVETGEDHVIHIGGDLNTKLTDMTDHTNKHLTETQNNKNYFESHEDETRNYSEMHETKDSVGIKKEYPRKHY